MTETTTTSRVESAPIEQPQQPSPQASKADQTSRWLVLLERYGLVVVFVAIGLFFAFNSASSDTFATMSNVRTIVGNQVVLAVAALASIVPLTAGKFDLSVGATLGLSSVATAAAMSRFDAPILVAAMIGILLGAFVGVLNGLLVAKAGVNAFITTLGVATVIGGLIQWYTSGLSIIGGIPKSFTAWGTQQWFGVPRGAFVLVVISLLVWYVLEHTPFGRYLASVGSNASAARLVGLNVDRLVVWSFVMSGLLAGVAGVLQVARASGASPQIGPTYLLPALSAAFLGATVFRPGQFNVPGTLVAVFFVATTVSGMVLSGVKPWIEQVFQGIALIFAVALSTIITRHRTGVR